MDITPENLRLIEAVAGTPAGAALLKAIDDKGPEAVRAWRGGLTSAALEAAGPRVPGVYTQHSALVSAAVGYRDPMAGLAELEAAWIQRKTEGHAHAEHALPAVRTLLAELRRRAGA
ncbi:MAG: hypothetical protein EKK55_16265 [Rhodocyclaceae bacterium]|nr:MAG: hypothetical protein EKK55_16265 [Rhodocyclaceae bacterium]